MVKLFTTRNECIVVVSHLGCYSDKWQHVKIISTGLQFADVLQSMRRFLLAKSESTLKKKYFVYCFGQHFKVTATIHRSIILTSDHLVFMGSSSSYPSLPRSRRVLELFRTTSRTSSWTEIINLLSTNRTFQGYGQRQRTTNTEEIPDQHVWRTAFILVDDPAHHRLLNLRIRSRRQAIKEADHFLLKSRDLRLSVFERRLRDFLPEIQSFPSSQGETPIIGKTNGNDRVNILVLSGKEQLMPAVHSLGDVSTQEHEVARVSYHSSSPRWTSARTKWWLSSFKHRLNAVHHLWRLPSVISSTKVQSFSTPSSRHVSRSRSSVVDHVRRSSSDEWIDASSSRFIVYVDRCSTVRRTVCDQYRANELLTPHVFRPKRLLLWFSFEISSGDPQTSPVVSQFPTHIDAESNGSSPIEKMATGNIVARTHQPRTAFALGC